MATAEAQQSEDTNMSSQSEHHKDAFIDFMGGVAGKYNFMFFFSLGA